MAVYAVGDVQGCAQSLEKLLDLIRFDPGPDRLWLCGDLVNRGPDSLQTLRLVYALGDSAVCVLGNHDLHLLAVAAGVKAAKPGDTLAGILQAPDCDSLLHWLRRQPLVHVDSELKTLMVHAGVYPGWQHRQLVAHAEEIQTLLRGEHYRQFLKHLYGHRPTSWDAEMRGWPRARFITNALTRMRYCDRSRGLDFTCKDPPGSQPAALIPWFEHPDLACRDWRIVSGHWSSLGFLHRRGIIALDSGCVWGGHLTAVRLDGDGPLQHWQLSCHAG